MSEYIIKITTQYSGLDKETLLSYLKHDFGFPEKTDELLKTGQISISTRQPDGNGLAETTYTLCDTHGLPVGDL